MPQLQLPIFPAGLTPITNDIGFQREEGKVVYFHGHVPVFQHAEKDLKSFRLFTSQLIVTRVVQQRDIVRAFQVPLATVKRYTKVFREQGAAGFFRQPRRRGETVLTPAVKQRVQQLLDEGQSVPEVAQQTKVLANTLHKAIRAGRLHAVKKKR
jgi:transposase